MLLERIRKTITRYNMLPSGCRVAVAVSGGADSVCLLLALVELAPEFGFRLAVAHFNHKLRGQAADDDEEFVRQLAKRLKVPFYIGEMTLTDAGRNLEQIARNARYTFFRGLIESNLADRIAVGHTRDDQAETVLFRILRGSGSTGIAGVHPMNDSGVVRPLLDVSRAEVVEFLGSQGEGWREDQSNLDSRYARNRIRHSLLPELQRTWNPQLASSLAHLADLAFEEERWWQAEMKALLSKLCQPFGGGAEVPAKSVVKLPKAVARRLVRALVSQAKGDLHGVEFEHVECVLELAGEDGEERSVQLPGVWITRSCGVLWLRRAGVELNPPPVTYLSRPGTYPAPDGSLVYMQEGLDGGTESSTVWPLHQQANGATLKSGAVPLGSVDVFNGGSAAAALSGSAWVLQKVELDPVPEGMARNQVGGQVKPSAVQLRGWRAGDRYRLHGHMAEQKMKEMFQRAQVPSWRRPFWPIVTFRDAIIWAKQFGPAAGFAGPAVTSGEDSVRWFRIWGNENKAAVGGEELR